MGANGTKRYWWRQRENILMVFGLVICSAEFFFATILGYPYHFEFFIGGAAFCGISVFQRLDKK